MSRILSRRSVLVGFGGGLSGLILRADPVAAQEQQVLEILSGETDVTYRFTVDGEITKTQTGRAKAQNGDRIVQDGGTTMVEGRSGSDSAWEGDAYEITGPIEWIGIEGDAEIIPNQRGMFGETGGSGTDVLEILSNSTRVNYRVTVDGDITRTETERAKAHDGDDVFQEGGNTIAEGSSNADSFWEGDAYEITGPITNIEIEGDGEIIVSESSQSVDDYGSSEGDGDSTEEEAGGDSSGGDGSTTDPDDESPNPDLDDGTADPDDGSTDPNPDGGTAGPNDDITDSDSRDGTTNPNPDDDITDPDIDDGTTNPDVDTSDTGSNDGGPDESREDPQGDLGLLSVLVDLLL